MKPALSRSQTKSSKKKKAHRVLHPRCGVRERKPIVKKKLLLAALNLWLIKNTHYAGE